MSIKKGLKKSRKVLLAIAVPFLAVAIGVTALIGALSGAGNNKRLPAGELADSTTAVSGSTITIGANGKIDFNSNAGVKQLIEYIGGTGKNYNDVANGLTTPKLASAFTAKTVTFGGVVWNVMYVSKADYEGGGTEKGDVIVTLWQADLTSPDLNGSNATKVYTSAYTPWYADTPNAKYPSAMYGSSLIRSTLVGSSYVATNGATSLTAGTQDAHWKLFTTNSSATTNGFGEMLATPANMAWQKTQKAPATLKPASSNTSYKYNYPWYFPNDAWGDIGNTNGSAEVNGGCWYNKSGTGIYNYSDNENNNNGVYKEDSAYTAWKNDKLWLPSMTETGWSDNSWINAQGTAGSGLWNANASQRASTGSSSVSYAWLRSGTYHYAVNAILLNSSGGYNSTSTTNSYAVRPALHLNLKSAAKAAGLFEQPIEYHTNYGTAPIDPDGKYIPGTDKDLMSVEGTIPANLEFNGWAKGGYDGEIITSLEGQGEPLDLYATFKPGQAASAAPTPADKIINTYYGATNVTMSAALSHALVGGTDAMFTISTYWRYNDGATNIAASAAQDGITITDGVNPKLVLTRPAQARSGKYTLYYTLEPTAAAAATGIRKLADQKACDFQLTVYGAQATVAELPTLSPSQIYVGSPIVGTQLVGGHVTCATMEEDNVTGTWEITSTGVFTSSGKITAKFTPTDPDIAPIDNVEIPTNAIQLSAAVSEDVSNVGGQAAVASTSINFDYNTDIGFTISGNKVTFSVTQDGVAKTPVYTISAPAGYDVYLTCDGEEITGSPIKNSVENRNVVVKYRAKQVGYTVYYLLQSADGTDNGGYPTATTSTALEAELGKGYVYKYSGTGYTGDDIIYLDAQNLPLNAALSGGAGNMSQRTVDTAKTGNIGKIKGDGSSVALVYLKLNEYTVTYSAGLGASPSSQEKKVRYGAKLTAPARKPTKSMSDFRGWLDKDGVLVINDKNVLINDNITVTADVTLTAKFDVKQFHITFNLNIADSLIVNLSDLPPYSLPGSGDLTLTTNSANLGGERVKWDVQSLFPDDENFDFTETSVGICTITYNIDNVPRTMSIKGIKPSAIGYDFKGWYIDNNEETAPTTTISKPNINTYDMELTARWSPAKYTMHYDKQDGSYNAVTTGTVYQQCLFSSIDKLKPENNPKRSGYNFEGWYITPSTDTSTGHTLIENNLYVDEAGAYFTIANISKPYGNKVDGYDFSDLTLYAEWSSIDAYIEDISDTDVGNLSFEGKDGKSITETDPVHIGDTITVTVSPKNGYEFVRLIVNGDRLDAGVLHFTIKGKDVDTSDTIIVDAEYKEKRYEIKYSNNGGESAGGTFNRWYTPSMLTDDDQEVVLSSNLTRLGYDFRGWKFDDGSFAHEIPSDGDLRGKKLCMFAPTGADGKTRYRDVNLTAVWEEQTATVNLYNANYTNDEYSGTAADGYVITVYNNLDLKTDMEIQITNPSRSAFDFLGWATSRNGAVVYPVVENEDTISYKVNADHDSDGKPLNLNNLYAVWHIKGVNRIIMTVDNNGCTYGGAGVKMTAKPAQSYVQTSGESILLTYRWYRIYDGMYDLCFTVGKVFISNEKTTGYEFNGVYYAADGKTIVTDRPAGDEFEYRRFEESSAGTGCVLVRERDKLEPSDIAEYTVKYVGDCGRYVCVVEVAATSQTGSTTRAGGYGEMEVYMNKAEYGNLVLKDDVVTYNAKSRGNAIRLALGKQDGAALSTTDGVNYLSLPDYRLDASGNRVANSNSKLIVTYKYYIEEEDGSRVEITDVNKIKNVGTYYVVVSFAFTPDGDKGNYNLIDSEEAVLEIIPFVISEDIGFTFVHGEERTTATVNGVFSGDYDGVAYSVEAQIKDRFGVGSDYVAQTDDVTLNLVVYDVTEDGDKEHAGETVDAGRYCVVVTGLDGEAAGNYVLKNGLKLRQEYLIAKSVYAVSKKIEFADKTVEFDNELHTLEINVADGFEIPSTVTVKYDAVFEAEDGSFTTANHLEDNFNADGNAGRYAGVYTITVKFEDSASANYAEIPAMTAKLTITKANLFAYFTAVHGEDLLGDADFVSKSFAFNANKDYLPTIAAGSRLANTNNFAITYEYYVVNEEAGTKALLGENEKIKEAGKYEIVANIEFVSPLYRNNFDDVLASESTITYVIRNVDVESINVTFSDAFEAGGRVVKLGDSFNYSWIKQIDVVYLDKETGERSTRPLTGDSIALAQIILENEQPTFWHVGSFDVKVSVYGAVSENAYPVVVKQEINEVILKYNTDDGAYVTVPDGGFELLSGKTYAFKIEYTCTDDKGATVPGSTEATVAAGGLVLGKNVLTVSSDYYVFGEVSVDTYEVLTGVTWQFSLDGSNWTDVPENNQLPYAGKVYRIRAVSDSKTFEAHNQSGADVINVSSGYVMEVGRSGNYKIDETYSFKITPKVLSFVWNTNTFEYDMFSHTPTITSSGLEAVDEGLVTFGFSYLDASKNVIPSAGSIIPAGVYYISVTLGGDVTARGNYTLNGAENAKEYQFTITRAAITADVYYNEHNYGRNISYVGNSELRLSAMHADFGESATISGQFKFINPVDDAYETISGKDFADDLKSEGQITLNYSYVPSNKNYQELIGQLTITVNSPTLRTGDGALSVEFGRDAIRFYLLDQTLDLHGIEVYQLYNSTYQDNGVWYGARTLVEDPIFRLKDYTGSLEGYKITKEDRDNLKIVLIARSGSSSGTLTIPVISKNPTGMEVANPDEYRKTYYVGETPDFGDIVFRVLFGSDTPPVEATVGTVTSNYTGGELTSDMTSFTVKFTYYSISLSLEFSVSPKEDLKVVLPTSKKVLTYTGNEIPVPELSFTIKVNGKDTTVGQRGIDGVEVSVAVYNKDNRLSYLMAEGKYTIIYTFKVTNPKYNEHDPENFEVEITTNPYKVEIELPEVENTPYTGEDISIPKPTVGKVTDSTNDDEPVPENSISRVYTIYDDKLGTTKNLRYDEEWTVIHSGKYTITVTVTVARANGEEPYTARTESYEFIVTQAQNDQNKAVITGPEFVLIGENGEIDFSVFKLTAEFGAKDAVWEYSSSIASGYSTTKPTTVGEYYIRAKITETDDYTGLTTNGKPFEVRGTGIELEGGEGSIKGGNGIGDNWELEIKHMEAEAVSQVSISKQDVHDGYEVVLKKPGGTVVSGEGEYTVRIKLSDELGGRSDLKVFFKDANGNTVEKSAKVVDGYIEFKTSEFGTFIITSAQPKASVGMLVAVIVLGVVAAGMIAACIIVFIKKKKKGEQQ